MKIMLYKVSYEKLIKQVLYIEENMDCILDMALQSESFASRNQARVFFLDYIKNIESLFEDIQIINKVKPQFNGGLNLLPFIVIDSHFTLCDERKRRYFCHLSYDNSWDRKNPNIQLYFLSASGLVLLSKQIGQTVEADIGMGVGKYTISSIKII